MIMDALHSEFLCCRSLTIWSALVMVVRAQSVDAMVIVEVHLFAKLDQMENGNCMELSAGALPHVLPARPTLFLRELLNLEAGLIK